MPDSLIAIKHFLNNTWAFLSSIYILDLGFTFADMLLGVWIISILAFIIRSFAFPDGGVNFGIISRYVTESDKKHNFERESAESLKLAEINAEYKHNIDKHQAFEAARRNTGYKTTYKGSDGKYHTVQPNKQNAINNLTKK